MITERRYNGRVEWPNDACLAVLITFDFQAEEGIKPLPNGHTDYKELTERRYGGTCGIWHILRILDQYRFPCTFRICGGTAEKYPEAVREIQKRGYEIAAHGLHHEPLEQLNPEEEVGIIERAVACIQAVTGERPLGWKTPNTQCSPNTVEILARCGFLWRSDSQSQTLPYVYTVDGRRLVELPHTYTTADLPLYNPGKAPGGIPRKVLSVWRGEFDQLYREAQLHPTLFNITFHPLVSGRPARAKALDEFLKHVVGHPKLWFARSAEVAGWWLKQGY